MTYTAAVITISDKGSKGLREDTAGPGVVTLIKNKGFDVVYAGIVPDEEELIKKELLTCADEKNISLILTVGGTGFSKRDITPESTLKVIERRTPGIPEAMRAYSMTITDRACLSRMEAGIRGNSLIINLPGSKKAAVENLEAVIDSVSHGLDVLIGDGDIDCGTEK